MSENMFEKCLKPDIFQTYFLLNNIKTKENNEMSENMSENMSEKCLKYV